VIQAKRKLETKGTVNMRYQLSDCEWSVIRPMLPNKPRGNPRVDNWRINQGGLALRRTMA